ncbi:MAG TPA: EpsD family peptidyl-prolyl cis-trans isomerase [Burkholderiaceae bacterium]
MSDLSILARRLALVAAAAGLAAGLSACGRKHEPTQAAARVDGTEITVHEINYRVQRDHSLRADQVEAAGRRALNDLIREQLFVEKAEKAKVDKEPDAQQALDAARRGVLVQAYLEQQAGSVAPPTDDAVRSYYDANPQLFSNRRIYTVHEFLALVTPDQAKALEAMVDQARPVADFQAWFKAQNVDMREQEVTRPAEQLPPAAARTLSSVPAGHGVIALTGNRAHVTLVVSSEPRPVGFDEARPVIQRILTVEGRRSNAEATVAALRSAAKIEYAPQYAALAASGPALGTLHDTVASGPMEVGERVSLPASSATPDVHVTLPTDTSSGVRVSLPGNAQPGVRISLPTTPASSVDVHLSPQASQATGKP